MTGLEMNFGSLGYPKKCCCCKCDCHSGVSDQTRIEMLKMDVKNLRERNLTLANKILGIHKLLNSA